MFPVELMVNLNFDRYLSFFQAIERKAILENKLDEKETLVEQPKDEKMKQEVHCMNSDIPKETKYILCPQICIKNLQ